MSNLHLGPAITASPAVAGDTPAPVVESSSEAFAAAVSAIARQHYPEAIERLERLADQGVVGSGIAYNRGLSYYGRAFTPDAQVGDLGRAAHGFEEALRRQPHDSRARRALEDVQKEIARRAATQGLRVQEAGSAPPLRAVATFLPANVWAAGALTSSVLLTLALLARPRVRKGFRLFASTLGAVALTGLLLFSALGAYGHHIHTSVREGVIVSPRVVGEADQGGKALDLFEGTRVDIVEELATTTKIETEQGRGFVPRSALRKLPPMRP